MTTPFYVSPEQFMRDKSEYARKGIARGRSVLVLSYADGILFVAENPSTALHKVSEIYDRIAFAAVGKYNEFENLRVAGVRLADLRGYAYDRADVTGRALANAYAQTLGTIFTQEAKPYEVEIVVAEVGDRPEQDQMYRLTYDGSVADESGFVAMGGKAEELVTYLREHHREGLSLHDAMDVAVRALAGQEARDFEPESLEVAVLDRTRPRRKFKRVLGARLGELMPVREGTAVGSAAETQAAPADAPTEASDAAAAEPEPPAGGTVT